MRHDSRLPQFQTDYIISWDFSDEDFPAVCVTKIGRDEKGVHLEAEVLGISHQATGCISLRQVLEEYEAQRRAEAERMKDAEQLRKTFGKKEAEEDASV